MAGAEQKIGDLPRFIHIEITLFDHLRKNLNTDGSFFHCIFLILHWLIEWDGTIIKRLVMGNRF